LLDFVWIPPYAMLSFFHGIHGIVVRQAKTSFRSRPFPNLSAAATDVAAFFSFTVRHISDTHESYQTTNSLLHWNSETEVRILGEHHVSSHIARLQAILATKDDTGATLQNTSSCATFFGGRMAQKAPQTNTSQGCVILRTCLSNNKDRVPGSLAGSLARSLDLTYCSSRFVEKGQLEYRCKLRISVLVLRVWWALIGWAGWRCKLGVERERANRSDIRQCVSSLFWGMTEGMVKQSNGINGKKALCGYSSGKGKFMRARGY
jgi:hypothetical protein